ncbi:MAG: hypothetical protein WCA29_04360 [Jiangellales bacterium]
MTDMTGAATETADLARLRAENEALRRALSGEKSQRTRRARLVGAWVAGTIAVLAVVLALLTVWTFRTLNNTDLFVDRVGSIVEQPEVAAAIGDAAAAELVNALDLEQRLSDALPEEVAVAAGPISNAAQGYLAQGTAALVASDAFQTAWDASLAAGHKVTIGVLSGSDTTAIENTDGTVVLNLTPVVNSLVAEGADFLSGLLDRDVNAPELTGDDIDAAIAALEQQLGTDLPADFGQIVLFQSDDLASAQLAYQVARTSAWLAPLAALVMVLIALAVAPNRVRAALGIAIGVALGMLLVAIALEPLQSTLLDAVADDGLANAVAASFSTVLSSLRSGIVVVTVLGVIAAALMFLTGRSSAAERSREVVGRSPSLAAAHRGAFLAGGFVVVLLVLALIPGQSWGQLGFGLLVYAGYALAVVLAPRPRDDRTADELAP